MSLIKEINKIYETGETDNVIMYRFETPKNKYVLKLKLRDVADLVKNDLLESDIREILTTAVRKNNSKRDFLFINTPSGKPTSAEIQKIESQSSYLASKIHDEIPNNVNICGSRIDIIGFAETAILLGGQVYDSIRAWCKDAKVNYLRTTRLRQSNESIVSCEIRNCSDLEKVDFNEEHSHAIGHSLYVLKNKPPETLIIVDDEYTTGNTVFNLIDKLVSVYGIDKIKTVIMASVLNIMSESDKDRLLKFCKDVGIDLKFVSLLNGELIKVEDSHNSNMCDYEKLKNIEWEKVNSTENHLQNTEKNVYETRTITPTMVTDLQEALPVNRDDWYSFKEDVFNEACIFIHEINDRFGFKWGDKIPDINVIGITESIMFAGEFASAVKSLLTKEVDTKVYFSSTTQVPIETRENNYVKYVNTETKADNYYYFLTNENAEIQVIIIDGFRDDIGDLVKVLRNKTNVKMVKIIKILKHNLQAF